MNLIAARPISAVVSKAAGIGARLPWLVGMMLFVLCRGLSVQAEPLHDDQGRLAQATADEEPEDLTVLQEVSAEGRDHRLWGTLELGFLGVLDHRIQFSKDGTYFDYDDEGGQDVLFFISRLSLDLQVAPRHQVTLLYQPLELTTAVLLERNVSVDGLVFPQGTPMSLRYSFPFYRVSYQYQVLEEPEYELEVGGSLQIRNAAIDFQSQDGTLFRSNRGIGPVPLLRVRGRYRLTEEIWLGSEIDGIYAPISYLNGSDNEVEGALLDASVRAGLRLSDSAEAFFNLRYLAGGAVGTSDDEGPGDGYTRNWLHFMTVTVGLSHALF